MIYQKWRELDIDLSNIKFKNIKIKEIISYPPAGNDVIECVVSYKNKTQNVFIKFERSKMSNFTTEIKHLDLLKENHLVPELIEYGIINNKIYEVLEKKHGERLSVIFKNNNINKEEYLINYGLQLGLLHKIKNGKFDSAFQRPINTLPKSYDTYDNFSNKVINWLEENIIIPNKDTFVHGDFHYGNILFNNRKVSGILDFEYSGMGFKEQDIAWACTLRPGQCFMDNFDDIYYFFKGYLKVNNFNFDYFKWCYINASIHFYLMNMSNEKYKEKLIKLINDMKLRGGIYVNW